MEAAVQPTGVRVEAESLEVAVEALVWVRRYCQVVRPDIESVDVRGARWLVEDIENKVVGTLERLEVRDSEDDRVVVQR